ncbi:MAG: CusA/CzcA family heavy metal efflux RND transporter, partial [Chitinophagia bacterium]|nr:CusA/CzcA family heavy metal efflux RND transporter [Chitinophagia bacterium]
MLNAIIRFSVRNKLIVGLFTLAWIIWGIIELIKLPVDALPDITSNQVQVITVSPTLGSLEVERLITFPIEQASSNIQRAQSGGNLNALPYTLLGTVAFISAAGLLLTYFRSKRNVSPEQDDTPPEPGVFRKPDSKER